jgi:hypothetical protein
MGNKQICTAYHFCRVSAWHVRVRVDAPSRIHAADFLIQLSFSVLRQLNATASFFSPSISLSFLGSDYLKAHLYPRASINN